MLLVFPACKGNLRAMSVYWRYECASLLRVFVFLFLTLLVTGCGTNVREVTESALSTVSGSVDHLGRQLDSGKVANASLLAVYADKLSVDHPEYRDVARLMKQEGTREGTLYTGLKTRVGVVRDSVQSIESGRAPNYKALASELNSIHAAADPSEFNRALADPVNVLADLSGGTLARVDAVSAQASKTANGAGDFGPGSQLVGNPNYGQWRTNSSGTSFWVWYGQFSLMRHLMGGPRIGYGDWSGRRDYSYYHDYGRSNYTSPRARAQQAQVENNTRRKFASQGKKFQSPYARQRSGASTQVSRQKFASRPKSRAASSVRGWGSGGTRGPRRGK